MHEGVFLCSIGAPSHVIVIGVVIIILINIVFVIELPVFISIPINSGAVSGYANVT